jgi:hypothetical protein
MIAGVDPFQAVSGEKVLVKNKTGIPLQDRYAHLLGGTGVDGGFIDDHIALFQNLSHGLRGLDQRGEVRPLVAINGGGHGDDKDVAREEIVEQFPRSIEREPEGEKFFFD